MPDLTSTATELRVTIIEKDKKDRLARSAMEAGRIKRLRDNLTTA